MLFHLVSEGSTNDCRGLASAAVVAEHLNYAVLKRRVLHDLSFKAVGADDFRQDVGLELLRLVMIL